MMKTEELVILISALISICAIYAFFRMSINLRSILDLLQSQFKKRELDEYTKLRLEYHSCLQRNDQKGSEDALTRIILLNLIQEPEKNRPEKYDQLKKQHGHIYEKWGRDFPFYPFK